MRPDRLSVRQVAERAGWGRAETLQKLQDLHEKHGGVLFRRPGRRTKYWVAAETLPIVWRSKFGRAPDAVDLSQVHDRIDHAIDLAERALEQLGTLRRQVGRCGQNGPVLIKS